MRMAVNLESVVCACASHLLSLPAPEEEGTWLPMCICFTRVLHAGTVEGSTLPVAVCVTSRVSVLCACVSVGVSVCLSDPCSVSLLVEPANRIAIAMSPSLGRGPGSPGWAPATRPERSWVRAAGRDSQAPYITFDVLSWGKKLRIVNTGRS